MKDTNMKTLVPAIALTSALLLVGRAQSIAQPAGAEAAPPPTPETQPEALPTELSPAATSETAPGVGLPESAAVQLPPDYELRLLTATRAPGDAGQALVVRSAETDTKTEAALEADLEVMSHLLHKTLRERLGESTDPRNVLGIDVVFAPGSRPIRALYLDGYGALFLLNVGFPLVSPPHHNEPPTEKPPTDSAWEDAKREVYGQPSRMTVLGFANQPYDQQYDEQKVNKLKAALLEALKSATNIRGLKSDDWISVCVSGGARTAAAVTRASVEIPGNALPPVARGGDAAPDPFSSLAQNQFTTVVGEPWPVLGTRLTLRVKKADLDAFAKGKLNAEELRAKASFTAYVTDAGGWAGNRPGYTIRGQRTAAPRRPQQK
jgi:hypothetical protein